MLYFFVIESTGCRGRVKLHVGSKLKIKLEGITGYCTEFPSP